MVKTETRKQTERKGKKGSKRKLSGRQVCKNKRYQPKTAGFEVMGRYTVLAAATTETQPIFEQWNKLGGSLCNYTHAI